MKTMILLLPLLGLATSEAAQPAVSGWSGDVSRSALATLPRPETGEGDGGPFLFGRFADAESWERFRAAAVGTEPWPEVDWQSQALIYVAFDGATRLLQLEQWDEEAGRLSFAARFSRRPEGPDGPCSLLLQRVGLTGERKVTVAYRRQDGGVDLLGEVSR